MGVIIIKKINIIIIGEINFPKYSPNLIQTELSGVSIFEFNKPKIKNVKPKIKAHTLISEP